MHRPKSDCARLCEYSLETITQQLGQLPYLGKPASWMGVVDTGGLWIEPEPVLLGSLAPKGDGTSSKALYGSCMHRLMLSRDLLRREHAFRRHGQYTPVRPTPTWLTSLIVLFNNEQYEQEYDEIIG